MESIKSVCVLPGEFVVGGQLSKEGLMEFGIISCVAEDDSFSIVRWGEDDGKRETTIPPSFLTTGKVMGENGGRNVFLWFFGETFFLFSSLLIGILWLRCFCKLSDRLFLYFGQYIDLLVIYNPILDI